MDKGTSPRKPRRQRAVDMALREKPRPSGFTHMFTRFASVTSGLAGTPWAFVAALTVIAMWGLTGPLFNYSTDWSLAVNTITTIITFLMVFLIQNTQNRDAKAIHLKLDELLRAVPEARQEFMEAEEEDLDEIEREKEIVDRDDPAPPAHKKRDRPPSQGDAVPGNGKAKRL